MQVVDDCEFADLEALNVISKLYFEGLVYDASTSGAADGAVSGVACALPELMARMDRAIREGQAELATGLNARLLEFIAHIEPLQTPATCHKARLFPLEGSASGPCHLVAGI